MNDSILAELKTCVERAVRPVRVGLSRKRRIREELLSHLISVYDEELAECSDEQGALQQALRRFGDPQETTQELRKGVSPWDQFRCLDDQMRLKTGESFPHLLVRHLLMSCVMYSVALLLMVGSLFDGGRLGEFWLAFRLSMVICVVMSLFTSVFVWISNRLSRALHGADTERSLSVALGYCLATLGIFPLMMVLTYWGLGYLSPPPTALLFVSVFSPLAPLGLVLLSRQAADEIRHEEEWARLNLDE